jgi:hypothetical protein
LRHNGEINLNTKVLTIALVLVIFAIFTSPALAVLPSESPLPSGNPFNFVWNLLKDLQNQITNIQLTPGPQGPQGEQGPAGKDGADGATVHFGDWQELHFGDWPSVENAYYDVAETDGIITCMCWNGGENATNVDGMIRFGNEGDLIGIVGSTGEVQETNGFRSSKASITMPVRKGDQWYIDTKDCQNVNLNWFPLTT